MKRFVLTPFDKALAGVLLPLIGTACEKYFAGADLKIVVFGLITSACTGLGVYFKANSA